MNFFSVWKLTYISRRKLLIIAATVTVVIACIRYSFIHSMIEQNIEHATNFRVRSILGKDPVIDPRIKIFIFDDPTVSYVDALDVDLKVWGDIFQAIDDRRPAHIVVDKLFFKPSGRENHPQFIDDMKLLNSKVSVAVFLNPNEIPNREKFSSDTAQFDINYWLKPNADSAATLPSWLKNQSLHIYGADKDIRSAFSNFGHIVYKGTGVIEPLVRVDEHTIVPHISFTIRDSSLQKASLTDGTLSINNHRVHTNTEGTVLVNLTPPERINKNVYSMKALIDRARNGGEISVVNEGDFVIILPGMFTGSTDWIHTSVGYIPGGYLIISTVNSVLTGNWLYLLNDQGLLAFFAVMAGIASGAILWAPKFWIVLAGAVVILPTAGMCAFAFAGIYISWVTPVIAFALSGSAVFAERTRTAKLEQIRINKELETARLVQKAFFPEKSGPTNHVTVEGYYRPASECSGDWWGHFNHCETEYVMIGDALGHGVGTRHAELLRI